jgi:UTP--glucose-1-phosphate uridylyltransferase
MCVNGSPPGSATRPGARDIVGDEPLALLLADDFMVGKPGSLRQRVDSYNRTGGNVVCAQEVAEDESEKCGIITPGARDGALTEVKGLAEKPATGAAPSNLAVIGRYILQPEVMRVLARQELAPAAGSSWPTQWCGRSAISRSTG